MLRLVLPLFLSFNLFALEILINSAKEDSAKYSILNLKNSQKFLCQEEIDDFNTVTKVICAFKNKPSSKLKPIKNDFYQIDSFIKNKTFFIVITPFFKIKLVPIIFNLVTDNTVYTKNTTLSNYWVIVGYKDKLPLIYQDKKSEIGLNIPFVMDRYNLPFVDGLDMKGNPVHIKKVQDVTSYLQIKKYFKKKDYNKCLDLIETVMYEYPNSLFRAELLYYKILVYSKLKNYDSVIEFSKEYLKDYSSDENVPEILSLTANAYAKNGLNIDADYFFDRLFSEHADSVYKYWGYIYKGEMFEASGGIKKALSFYKKALNKTDNLDVAVMAAYRLAQYYIGSSKLKESSKYILKIIKAKPKFLMQHLKPSIEMMDQFAEEWDYKTAIAMANVLIDNSVIGDDNYEKLLRNRAIWLTKTQDKKRALKELNRYLKEFKYGTYEDEIKLAKNELFFDINETNTTYRLEKYNTLIDEYENDIIGQRAIYEKAKLLLKLKHYTEVLSFRDNILDLDSEKFSDKKDIIYLAAKGQSLEFMKNKKCFKLLKNIYEYEIEFDKKYDNQLYSCALTEANFDFAKKIALKNLKLEDIEQKKSWLFKYIKVEFLSSHFKEVIKISNDLFALIDNISSKNNSQYKEIYRYTSPISLWLFLACRTLLSRQ